MRALLCGASPCNLPNAELSLLASQCAIVIGVDGGAAPLQLAGVVPDVIVGDMDSLDAPTLDSLEKLGSLSVRHPRDKDESDLEIALRWCEERGVEEAWCVGITGGRVDHTLASLGALGRHCALQPVLYETDSTTWVLAHEGRRFVEVVKAGSTVSVITLADGARMSARGLKWPLPHTLEPLWDRGLSNISTEPQARITIEAGVALVIVDVS